MPAGSANVYSLLMTNAAIADEVKLLFPMLRPKEGENVRKLSQTCLHVRACLIGLGFLLLFGFVFFISSVI
jgi:hypothetical protein